MNYEEKEQSNNDVTDETIPENEASKTNELFALITKARKKLPVDFMFKFINSAGISCWFKIEKSHFNFDSSVYLKDLLYGKFYKGTIEVRHWTTGTVVLKQKTAEEEVTDVLGKKTYARYVANFKDLLKEYNAQQMQFNADCEFVEKLIRLCVRLKKKQTKKFFDTQGSTVAIERQYSAPITVPAWRDHQDDYVTVGGVDNVLFLCVLNGNDFQFVIDEGEIRSATKGFEGKFDLWTKVHKALQENTSLFYKLLFASQ